MAAVIPAGTRPQRVPERITEVLSQVAVACAQTARKLEPRIVNEIAKIIPFSVQTLRVC